MENFSKRTTAAIFVGFLLLSVGWGICWQKVAEEGQQAVHCEIHAQHVTCTAGGKAT